MTGTMTDTETGAATGAETGPSTERLVLVTRPEPEGTRTAAALTARGLPTLSAPLTRIVHAEGVAPPQPQAEALVFTSANAVEAAAAQGWALPALPVYAVGPRTAEAARAAGHPSVTDGGGEAAALLAVLVAAPERHFCHLRGHHTARDLAGPLAAAGKTLTPLTVYEAVAAPLPGEATAALAAGAVAVAGLWSPRAATLFAGALGDAPDWPRAGLGAVVISPRAAAPLASLGLARVAIAPAPTGEAMLEQIELVARA